MHRFVRIFSVTFAATILAGIWLTFARPVAACEVYLPPNYRYVEQIAFDESRLPPGVSVNLEPPQWVIDEGLVGFVQLENQSTASHYLLFTFYLGDTYTALTHGDQLDSAVWSQGLEIMAGETFDIIGEGNLMQFAPGIRGMNVNNPTGAPLPAAAPPQAQRGNLYIVSEQQLSIVPFTLTYKENPAYIPEGTFHIYTLAERVELAPVIVQGVAETSAPEGDNTRATIRVAHWLKGSGPDLIQVGDFINTSCDYQIGAGEERIFFLQPEGDYYQLNTLQAGMFDALAAPESAGEISAITGQGLDAPAGEATPPRDAAPATVPAPTQAPPTAPAQEAAATGRGAISLWVLLSAPLAVAAGVYVWRRQQGMR